MHRYREPSYAMSAIGTDVVSGHKVSGDSFVLAVDSFVLAVDEKKTTLDRRLRIAWLL